MLMNRGNPVQFTTEAFETETEITGHIVAHLNVSCSSTAENTPSDIDLFVTIRHFGADGKESTSSSKMAR
jgi:predicted acyl esterase